jgi:proline dehydrogenase
MQVLLREGTYPAIATHDPDLIAATRQFATEQGIERSSFEFQMLYGIRRDLQRTLAGEGYPFRVYVPFGTDWFPYFMRRLGERPANVGFVLRSLAREQV